MPVFAETWRDKYMVIIWLSSFWVIVLLSIACDATEREGKLNWWWLRISICIQGCMQSPTLNLALKGPPLILNSSLRREVLNASSWTSFFSPPLSFLCGSHLESRRGRTSHVVYILPVCVMFTMLVHSDCASYVVFICTSQLCILGISHGVLMPLLCCWIWFASFFFFL